LIHRCLSSKGSWADGQVGRWADCLQPIARLSTRLADCQFQPRTTNCPLSTA